MDLALLVEEASGGRHREDALVPDAGMDVDAEAAVGPQGDEGLGLEIVAGLGHRHDERLAVERPEQLAAVGMVVAMPQQDAIAGERDAGHGLLRQLAEADDVMASHRLVAPDQLVAAPFAGEGALGGAALDAGAGVEPPPAGEWPRHDLDLVPLGIAHDLAVAPDRLAGGADHRDVEKLQSLGNGGIEIVENNAVVHAALYAALPRSSPASARSISATTLSRP